MIENPDESENTLKLDSQFWSRETPMGCKSIFIGFQWFEIVSMYDQRDRQQSSGGRVNKKNPHALDPNRLLILQKIQAEKLDYDVSLAAR